MVLFRAASASVLNRSTSACARAAIFFVAQWGLVQRAFRERHVCERLRTPASEGGHHPGCPTTVRARR
jgi:hypothetical protein